VCDAKAVSGDYNRAIVGDKVFKTTIEGKWNRSMVAVAADEVDVGNGTDGNVLG
jgi:hypothetical protein